MALYFSGRRSCQTLAGSMTWSSTLTNFGMTRLVSVVAGSGAVIVTGCSPVWSGAPVVGPLVGSVQGVRPPVAPS